MTRASFGERLRSGRAALRRDAVTPPARSRWAFIADAALAVGLAVGAFNGFTGRVQGQVTMTSTGAPIPPPPGRLPDEIPTSAACPGSRPCCGVC
ncbi:hypothetical protein [Dactylosporangium darangshiense]|uniref:hypothetical protein n=1 Tax=Dactylosporangium darangshiense TaxID=579108 RepID=UPI00363F022D